MTRIKRCGLATLLSFAVAAAGAALAQQPGQPPGGMQLPFGGMMGGFAGGGDLQLVANAAVQKELNLTTKQKGQLRSVDEAAKASRQEIFAAIQANELDPLAIGEQMTAIRQDQDAKVNRVLDKTQKTRLSQIKLQREGIIAISRSEVSSKLKITNPQSKQIKKVMESMNKEIAAAMPAPPQGFGGPPGGFAGGNGGPPGGFGPPGADDGNGNDNGDSRPSPKKKGDTITKKKKGEAANDPDGPGGPGGPGGQGGFGGGPGGPGGGPGGPGGAAFEEFREKMAQGFEAMGKARESATKQLEAILTNDQKAAWAKMIGEPFDVSVLQLRPGGPGGPGEPRGKGETKKAKKDANKEAKKDDGDNQ